MTDSQLLLMFSQSRDPAAFSAIVERYGGLVRSVARRAVHDEHSADDVAQGVFMALATKAKSVDGRFLAGWLLRATRYASTVAIRSAKRRRRHEQAAAVMQRAAMKAATEGGAGGGDREDAAQDDLARLDEAMLRLSTRDRSAIALRFYRGLSLTEVGQSLGLSDDAARKRIARAVQRLRHLIGNEAAQGGLLPAADLATLLVSAGAATSVATQMAAPLAGGLAGGSGAIAPAGNVGMMSKAVVTGFAWVHAYAVAAIVAAVVGVSVVGAWSVKIYAALQSTAVVAKQPAGNVPLFAPMPVLAKGVDPSTLPDQPVEGGAAVETYRVSIGVNDPIIVSAAPAEIVLLPTRSLLLKTGGFLNKDPAGHYSGNYYLALTDLASGKNVLQMQDEGFPITRSAVSANGKQLIFAMVKWGTGEQIIMAADITVDGTQRTPRKLFEGKSWAQSLAVSTDGTRAAATDITGRELRIWDLTTDRLLLDIKPSSATEVAFCDGKSWQVVAGGRDGHVRAWTDEGKLLWDVVGHTSTVTAIAFAPDGTQLATGDGNGEIVLWDRTENGPRMRYRLDAHQSAVNSLAYSPDSRLLASTVGLNGLPNEVISLKAEDRPVRIWDTRTGRQLACFPKSEDTPYSVRFGEDVGEFYVISSMQLSKFTIPKPLPSVPGTAAATTMPTDGQIAVAPAEREDALAFSNDGVKLFGGGYFGSKTWDAKTLEVKQRLRHPPGYTLIVRPDLDRAYAQEWSDKGGKIIVSDLSTGQAVSRFEDHLPMVDGIAISPSGKWLAAICGTRSDRVLPKFDPELRLYDLATGKQKWLVTDIAANATTVGFSHDGGSIMICGTTRQTAEHPAQSYLRELKLDDGSVIHEFTLPHGAVLGGNGLYCAILPGNEKVLAVVPSSSVLRWDWKTAKPLPSINVSGQIVCSAMSVDGKLIAIGTAWSNIDVFDVATGQRVGTRHRLHVGSIRGLAFSPDGKTLASTGEDKTIRLWSVYNH